MTTSEGTRFECKWEKGLRVGPAKVYFQSNTDKELAGVVREPLMTTKRCAYPLAPPLLLLQTDSYYL